MNGVFVDQHGSSVAIEQSNCRMAGGFSQNGISAVTALAYVTPEIKAFKLEREPSLPAKSAGAKTRRTGYYWRGCDARYARLMQLVEAEGKRGPRWKAWPGCCRPGAPAPARSPCANEKFHPDVETNFWTIATWVEVVFGPGPAHLIAGTAPEAHRADFSNGLPSWSSAKGLPCSRSSPQNSPA